MPTQHCHRHPSHESTNPSIVMNRARIFMEYLETFNTNMSLLTINIEDAYDFASLLFSPPWQSVELIEYMSEHLLPLDLLNTTKIGAKMPRMRGQVSKAMVEPREKKKFDRAAATSLKIQMQNIQQLCLEEMDWINQWKNFTDWGMEEAH
jgi:hypothetical protein